MVGWKGVDFKHSAANTQYILLNCSTFPNDNNHLFPNGIFSEQKKTLKRCEI